MRFGDVMTIYSMGRLLPFRGSSSLSCFGASLRYSVGRRIVHTSPTSEVNFKVTTKYDQWFEEALPKITVPSKMMRRIERATAKREEYNLRHEAVRGSGPLIISCKHSKFNHFMGHRYPKGDLHKKFLATSGWKSKKSAGDWMIFQPFMNLPAFHSTGDSKFEDLQIWPELSKALNGMSITEPTNIQEHAIPEIMRGNNCLVAAETGSGKTLAYLLPMIQSIAASKSGNSVMKKNSPFGIVLAPSRELISQIYTICAELCAPFNLTVDIVSGNCDIPSKNKPVDIVIASPGSLLPLARHKVYNLKYVQTIVLDEGDTLMDDSFSDAVTEIIQKINIKTESDAPSITGAAQVIIVSATMPKGLRNILRDLIDMNAISVIRTPKLHYVLPHIKQRFERVKPSMKSDIMIEAIKTNVEKSRPTLVFCNGANSACHIAYRLEDLNVNHTLLTGKLPDHLRTGRFEAFQTGSSNVMIATDIASRGLDTRRVQHVINYDFPNFISDYLHRIGRIGRVGSPARCMATSYISQPWEVELLWLVETSIRKNTMVDKVDANIKKSLVERNHGESGSLFYDQNFDGI